MISQNIWNPLTPKEVKTIFKDTDFRWWIAGGYTLEAFVGFSYRHHSDIDVLLLREETKDLMYQLTDWELYLASPPGNLKEWDHREPLPPTVTDIWVKEKGQSIWSFQIMINDSKNNQFIYKRDPSILFDIEKFTWKAKDEIPFLAPELQLLYKAKDRREKDDLDFQQCMSLMAEDKRKWLIEKITKCFSSEHPWVIATKGKG